MTTLGSLSLAGCIALAPLDGLTGGHGADASADVATAVGEAGADGGADVGTGDQIDAGAAQDATSTDGGSPDADAGLSYVGTVLADKPLAYWRVDEASGSTAHDSSGNGADAVYIGNVVHGVVGATPDGDGAITLDGTSGAVQAAAFSFTGAAPMSLEAWVMPAASTPQFAPVASNMDQSVKVGYQIWLREPNTGMTLAFERWALSGGFPAGDKASSTAPITAGSWHHLVATYDGSSERLYLDSVLQATTASQLALAANGPLYFGRNVFNNNFYPGGLDELAVYDHALAPDRVLAHYHASGR